MYPSWGKHGGGSYQHNTGQHSNYHNKPPPPRGSSLYSGNYGGYGSSGSYSASSGPGSSNFQSLREQHLQQMQQLQQLHQKQLQSVLHSSSTPYSGGSSHSSSGTWHGSSSSSGSTGYSSGPNYQQQHQHHGPPPSFPPPSHGPPPPFHAPPPNQQQQQHGPGEQQAPIPITAPPSGEKPDHKPPVTPTEDDQVQQSKLPVPQPALHQSNQSPAPNVPPVHLLHSQQQQYPPPPTTQSESTDRVIPSHTPPETNSPAGSTAPVLDSSEPRQEQPPDLSSMSLQEQQQFWYKQHLQSLQKLKQQQKNEKENKKQELTSQSPVPPPPKEPPADAAPPPPPPREELPPPPPPEEVKTDIVTSTEDPEEAARLKQLQAAAAQWQHTQHQRAGYQYQAMMQQHTHLQQLLQQYQQFMQQPAHLQTMPLEMQLRHFEMQQHQFIPLFQEWERHFKIWQEQFQAYPHKDQLKEYESQWKQWQDQMQSTYAHLHERVMTLRNMQHQYVSAPPYGMVGIPPYGQYHQPPPSVHGSMLPPPPVTSVPPPPVTSVPPPLVTSVPPPPVTSVPSVTSVPPPSVTSVPPPSGSRVTSVPPPPVTSVPPPMSVPPPPVTSVPPPPVTSVPPPPVTSVPPPMSMPPPPVTSVPPPMSVPPPPVTSVPPPMSVPPPPVTSVPPPMSVPPPPVTSVPPPMSMPPPIVTSVPLPPVPLPNCPPPSLPSQPAQTSPQVSSSSSKVFSETPNSVVIQPPSSLASGQPGFLTTSLPSVFTSSSPSVKPFDPLSPPSQGSPAESQRNSRLNSTSEITAPGFQTPAPKPDLPSGHCSQSKFDQQSNEKQGRFNQLPRFEPQHRFGPPPPVEPLPVSGLQQPPKFDSPVKTEQPPKETVLDAPTPHPPRITVPSKTESPIQPEASKSVSQPPLKLNEFTKMETLKAPAQQTKGDQSNKFEEPTAHVPRQSEKFDSTQPIPKDAMSQDQNLKTCKPSSSVPIISSSGNLTTDYDFDADGDFFLPNDPIPQTSVSVGEQKQSDSKENSLKVNLEEAAKPASILPVNDDKNVFASNRNVTKPQEVQKAEAKPFEKDTKKNSDTVAKPDTPKGTPKLCNLETQKAISTPKTEGFSQGPVPIRGPPGKALHSNIAPKPISAKQDSFALDYRGMHGEDKKENNQNQGINSWKNSQMEKQNLTERKPLLFHEETWHGEEEQGHFREPYFQNRGRGRPPMDREQVEDMSRQRGWEEPGSDYWPDREPFQRENRPPFRRPPLLSHEPMERDPRHTFPLPHDPLDRDRRHPPPLPYEYMEREPRHPPLLPHDTVERDTRRPPVFPQQVMDREPRHPPPLPHELIERDPRGHAPHEVIGREMRRPPISYDMERDRRRGEYFPEYEHEFDLEQNRFVAPYTDYNENYNQDQGYYMQREDWEVEDRRRNCPQYPPQLPPDRFCEDRWIEKRDHSYLYERDFQERGSYGDEEYAEQALYRQEERDYMPDRPEWSREALHERRYMPDVGNRRPQFEDRLEGPSTLPPSAIPPPHHDAPEVMDDSSGATKGVLALSQRQHEIILKAAQELKMLRERQEQFQVHNEYGPNDTNAQFSHAEPVAAGMLGFDMPPDNLQSKVFSTNDIGLPNAAQSFSEEQRWGGGQLHNQWDVGNSSPGPDHNFGLSGSEPVPPLSKPPVIPKTVDYGHGRDGATAKVEHISYGERITLRPDPVPTERSFEKEPLIPRDHYERDSFYERRADPYLQHREYSRDRERERERDSYREKQPVEYERERYERDRHLREERLPPGSTSRSGMYRDRDGRDSRDREREGREIRENKDHYGRPGFERPHFERGPDRPPYEHSLPGYAGEKRVYPEERPPVPVPPVPHPPPAQPRVEKKPEMKNVDDILKPPGRESRPERIVIIMRGLPGSGKTHVAKLIRDKEVEFGGAPPRVLGLDDYFMTEVEKVEKDPDTGKRVKKKVLEYEYEPEMEDTYRSSMLKTFRKTLDDGFFPFIIIDAINDRVKYFDQFWSAAKTKGFEVYLAEITADNQTCAKRNIHGRKFKDIAKMADHWETAPRHMVRLDIRSLLQDAAIEEVEMEDFNPAEEEQKDDPKTEGAEEEESDLGYIPKSKWEMDTSEAKLDKLDGLRSSSKRKREWDPMAGMEDYLQLPDDYDTRMSEPGKKRVRWADLEEKKDAERKRAIGFVVGQTDWEKITDESGQLAQRALNRTKYF